MSGRAGEAAVREEGAARGRSIPRARGVVDFGRLFADLSHRAGGYGVRVLTRRLPPETPAVFDGPAVALDPGCDFRLRVLVPDRAAVAGLAPPPG